MSTQAVGVTGVQATQATWGDAGSGYKILKQEVGTNVCGPCCAGMVVYLLRKQEPRIDQLVTIGNLMGVKGGWNADGSNATYVMALLKAYGVTARLVTGAAEMKSALQQSTARTPRIAMVQLPTSLTKNTSGYHWVVFVGRQTNGLRRASTYTVLDPLSNYKHETEGSRLYTSPIMLRLKSTGQETAVTGLFQKVICCSL
jgi:hypothetical protein